jgi:mRNA-degrading endonuclease RelE of RelBE toxin-antitoxin system
MKEHSESIEDMLKKLPPEFQEEVKNFVEFLLEKHMKRSHGKLTFDWAGAQKELQNQYSSVKLQHKISE